MKKLGVCVGSRIGITHDWTDQELVDIFASDPSSAIEYEQVIETLKEEMQMPAGIRDTAVDATDFERRLPEMVGQALRDSCTPTNPRTPDAQALTELYRQAWSGAPLARANG